jgi:predicted transcriptional regulator
MVQKYNLSQRKTAKLLGITESAVSQYVNKKRGNEVSLGCEIAKKIDISAKKIIDNKSNFVQETQKMLKIAKNNGVLCKVHKQFDNIPKDCNYCGVN